MTKEEMVELAKQSGWEYAHGESGFEPLWAFAKLVAEKAIKEALAQPKQEPVLWMMPDGKTADKWALQFYGGQVGKPLYTTPPQRTWVGLTDEDFYGQSKWQVMAMKYAEAKLKEKNT
jgi:hypothetical protein